MSRRVVGLVKGYRPHRQRASRSACGRGLGGGTVGAPVGVPVGRLATCPWNSPCTHASWSGRSGLDVRDDHNGAQCGDEVQDADAFDLVCVLAEFGVGGVAGDRFADLGVDGDGDQGAVQGVNLVLVGEVLQLLRSGVAEGDLSAASSCHQATAGRWAARRAR